jgi:hypothetical protein
MSSKVIFTFEEGPLVANHVSRHIHARSIGNIVLIRITKLRKTYGKTCPTIQRNYDDINDWDWENVK